VKTFDLLIAMILPAPGAVVATSCCPTGWRIPLTTTGSYGAFLFRLSPESSVPEFVFTFYPDQLAIMRAEYGNKNSKIVGWDSTASRLTVGDAVSYFNYPRSMTSEFVLRTSAFETRISSIRRARASPACHWTAQKMMMTNVSPNLSKPIPKNS